MLSENKVAEAEQIIEEFNLHYESTFYSHDELEKFLKERNIPIEGIEAYLSQSAEHQLVFMQFEKSVELAEHAHAAQVGFVLEGVIELVIDGVKHQFGKGDIYHIPAGAKHSGKVYAGYSDITFFAEANSYNAKE